MSWYFLPFSHTNDLLLFFTLLAHIRSGFFSWAVDSGTGTLTYLRHTRRTSCSLSNPPIECSRCEQMHGDRIAEQASLCTVRPVALLFIIPEDFGGHHQSGPATQWALQELRGAAFQCRLAESEFRRPLDFLSNRDTFNKQLHDGWPSFFVTKGNIVYRGPLPKKCPCATAHRCFKWVTTENQFIPGSQQSSSNTTPAGTAVHYPFWVRFTISPRGYFHLRHVPHRGALSINLGPRAVLVGCSFWNIARRSMLTCICEVFLLLLCLRGRLCRYLLLLLLHPLPPQGLLALVSRLRHQGFCR